MSILINKDDLLSIKEEISSAVNSIEYLDDTDEIEDVWYYAEQIKIQLFMLSRMIEAATPAKG